MKLVSRLASQLVLAAVLLASTPLLRADTIRYEGRPGSKLKMEGTSTVHDWTVDGGIIGGFMEFESNFPLDPAQPSGELKVTPKVEVNIPVRSLKSGKKLMDDIMHDALKVKDHPAIKYVLKEMVAKERKAGDPLKFDTKGEITVGGVSKPIEMVVTMTAEGAKLKSVGSKQLKMTDFGIKPPAPAVGLGLIKTADEVTITFEWVTVKKEPKTAAAN